VGSRAQAQERSWERHGSDEGEHPWQPPVYYETQDAFPQDTIGVQQVDNHDFPELSSNNSPSRKAPQVLSGTFCSGSPSLLPPPSRPAIFGSYADPHSALSTFPPTMRTCYTLLPKSAGCPIILKP